MRPSDELLNLRDLEDPQTWSWCCNCWSEGGPVDSCSIMLQNLLLWIQNKGAVSRTQREKGMCGAHCLGPISMTKRGQVDGAKEEIPRLPSGHLIQFPNWEHPSGWQTGPKVREHPKPKESSCFLGCTTCQWRGGSHSPRGSFLLPLTSQPSSQAEDLPQRLPVTQLPTQILRTLTTALRKKGEKVKDTP